MTPQQFKEARQSLGVSQSDLAALIGVQSDRTIRKWEAGERDIPGPAILLIQLFVKSPAILKLARTFAG